MTNREQKLLPSARQLTSVRRTSNLNPLTGMPERLDFLRQVQQLLTEKKLNGKEDAPVQWNFQKFMIDENGHWVGVVSPKESPFSEKIITWIEKE